MFSNNPGEYPYKKDKNQIYAHITGNGDCQGGIISAEGTKIQQGFVLYIRVLPSRLLHELLNFSAGPEF